MSIHLIKLAVGVEDFAHLVRLQSARTGHNAAAEQGPYPRHITRQRPRREAELLSGGSMYWVIKGVIRARQRLLALEDVIDADGITRCALVLDPELHPTQPKAQRAFQGWRYLDAAQAPADALGGDSQALPDDLARVLDHLGLL
ncbi:MAG: DUF1489 domain-containing protein [Rhodospirillales bacterium]|nr:DUF1489 domain-containing protein [Rhodospirillales bacterium]